MQRREEVCMQNVKYDKVINVSIRVDICDVGKVERENEFEPEREKPNVKWIFVWEKKKKREKKRVFACE